MTDFTELYKKYAPDVFRFAMYLSGNRSEAEDITSETFVRAWTAASRAYVTLPGRQFSALLVGDTAIFLLGATSEKAMELKAANFLQWQAMMWLKDRGARWYDLGGIDPVAECAGNIDMVQAMQKVVARLRALESAGDAWRAGRKLAASQTSAGAR